jgi:hypothetical protein
MKTLVTILSMLTAYSTLAIADPGRMRVNRQSQDRDALTTFTLKTIQVGGTNVSIGLTIPNQKNYGDARLTLHTTVKTGMGTQLLLPVRLDKMEDGQGWKTDLIIPTELARQSELELLLYRPSSTNSPPPGTGVVYDIDLRSYIDAMNHDAEPQGGGYSPPAPRSLKPTP